MCTQIQSHAGSEEEERKSKIKSKKKGTKSTGIINSFSPCINAALTGEPKLWPTSCAKVIWETFGGTWEA